MPFISNPEEYYLSILRFTVETGSLPVFIPTIQSNSPNNSDTIYSVCLEYTDLSGNSASSGQVYVQWVPQDITASVPNPPFQQTNGLQDNNTGYFNCYSYSYWTGLVDITLKKAYNALEADAISKSITLPSINAPFLDWDAGSGTAILYADRAGYNVFGVLSATNPDPTNPQNLWGSILVYMNAPLFQLYNSFPSFYLGYTGVTKGKNYLMLIRDVGGSNLITISPYGVFDASGNQYTYTAIAMYQENQTTATWSPITSFVFVSNTLPVTPNQISTPLVLLDGAQVGFGGNNSAIANVITDLVSDTFQYRPALVYEPRAENRLITLNGNRPIFNLDLTIFWRDKLGGLNPYRINSGETVTIKIAFLKKAAAMLEHAHTNGNPAINPANLSPIAADQRLATFPTGRKGQL